MPTRWLLVCQQDAQPAVVSGAMDCSGGTLTSMPVDTVITESSPLLNFGQLLAMTPDDALIISVKICFVWAIAWGFRAIAHSFFSPSERSQDE